MVRLATVQSGFEAKVLAARLGAEGIVWELRGAVDGPYPMGPVTVLVEEHELDVARELLLVDEVESSFDDADGHLARPSRRAGCCGYWSSSNRQPTVNSPLTIVLLFSSVLPAIR